MNRETIKNPKFLMLVFCMSLLMTLAPTQVFAAEASGGSVSAETKAAQPGYQELYRAFLKNGTVTVQNTTMPIGWYYVLDIDKKGAPELVICPSGSYISTYYMYAVYTVKKGKIVSLGDYTAFAVPRGVTPPKLYYVAKKKGLMTEESTDGVGGVWKSLRKISGSKIKVSYYIRRANNPSTAYYAGKNAAKQKKVKKSVYQKKNKKYFGNPKCFVMLSNTEANWNESFGY